MITLRIRRSFETFAAGEVLTLPDLSARALVRAYPGIFEYGSSQTEDVGEPALNDSGSAVLPVGSEGLDYGHIRYGEMMGATAVPILADTETPFVVRAPRVVADALKAPFSGFAFFGDDSVLRCRKAGDSYLLGVRLTVTPQVIGGWFSLGIMIEGNISGLAGPTSTRQVALSGAAGTDYRFDEIFQVFPSTGFAANGATMVMRSSVPAMLSSDVLFITPLVAAP